MMDGCDKCCGVSGALLLIFGVLFLLRDLNVWDFWGIQWWTAAFLLMGITGLAMKSCKDCKKMKK